MWIFWLGLAFVIIAIVIIWLAVASYNSANTQSQKNAAVVWMWIGGILFVIGLILMIWGFVAVNKMARNQSTTLTVEKIEL